MMRKACILAAATVLTALAVFAQSGSGQAADLMERARYWGSLHGAGIYCRRTDTDTFGRKAVSYMRRLASGQAEFEAARDKYGITAIEKAHEPPSSLIGGSCSAAMQRYREAMSLFSGN